MNYFKQGKTNMPPLFVFSNQKMLMQIVYFLLLYFYWNVNIVVIVMQRSFDFDIAFIISNASMNV